jgi:uncharacterized RDD family membrane protein YckC
MSDPLTTPPPPPPPPSGPPGDLGYGYAAPSGLPPLSSKGKRFGALLLETVLVIVTLFIGWIVWSIILWKKGQTPAKSLMKMRVVKLDTGLAADTGTMVMREVVGKWILGVVPFYSVVSAVIVLTDEKSQGLWDKIAGTVVVDDPDGRLAPA